MNGKKCNCGCGGEVCKYCGCHDTTSDGLRGIRCAYCGARRCIF